MKFLLTLFVILLGYSSFGQQVGSKVSFSAADGKSYTGTITEIQNEKYKVKYDGHGFEAWLTIDQFTLVVEQQPETQTEPSADPGVKTEPVVQETSTAKTMSRSDSIQLALKASLQVLQKILVVKRDTLTIAITGVDYDNVDLALLKENLKKVKGVKSLSMKYAASTASLEIACKGKVTDIWDTLPIENRSKFKMVEATDNNLRLTLK